MRTSETDQKPVQYRTGAAIYGGQNLEISGVAQRLPVRPPAWRANGSKVMADDADVIQSGGLAHFRVS